MPGDDCVLGSWIMRQIIELILKWVVPRFIRKRIWSFIKRKKFANAKEPIISYDILMYLRSEILDRQVKDVEHVLKRVAVDCANNRKLNIDTLDKKTDDIYECITEMDYDIEPKDVNLDTYDSIFLYPYIQYAISIIKKHFEKNHVILNLTIFIRILYSSYHFYKHIMIKCLADI